MKATIEEIIALLKSAWHEKRILQELQQELAPIFIIGGNRSGTSIVASLLSQHPELEGLFSGATDSRYDEAGHSLGFCESLHIWQMLAPSDGDRRRNHQLPFWSLPQYLSAVYRCCVRSHWEKRKLAWQVKRWRKTQRVPLIKDQYNTLRVGLITDIYPCARFVLVTRSWPSFLRSGLHKWLRDGTRTMLDDGEPRAGLHWHLVNLIARYDLECYAPGRYAEIWLDELHAGKDSAQSSLQRLLKTLSLALFDFDLRSLESQWSHSPVSPETHTTCFDDVRDVVAFERLMIIESKRCK